jgi:Ice-binding-like
VNRRNRAAVTLGSALWAFTVAGLVVVIVALVVVILVGRPTFPNVHLPALNGVPSPGAGAALAPSATPASPTRASPAPKLQAGLTHRRSPGGVMSGVDIEDDYVDVEDDSGLALNGIAAVPGSGGVNAVPPAAAAPLSAFVVTAPSLGGAANFAVLGGAGVTCTASAVTGNVGSKLTVTQTPTCGIAGAIHQGDATGVGAFNGFVTAFRALNALPCGTNLTGQALGGKTLAPGVYCFPGTTAGLASGVLTLNGPASGVWVFQVGTGMTTGTAQVIMAGGASACNVYWVLGTAATIGTGARFQGNILAGSAITFTGTNASLVGRALAQTAVTMTGTTISGCH